MKITSVKNKRQYPKYIYIPLDSRILIQGEDFFRENFTKSAIEILKTLIYFSVTYPCIYPAQETIAGFAKCSRKTTNEWIQKLQVFGLVKKLFRRKTWVLSLCTWLKTKKAKLILQALFMTSEYIIPVESYMTNSATESLYIKKVTVTSSIIIDKDIYIKKEEEKRGEMSKKAEPKPTQLSQRDIDHYIYLYKMCKPSEKKTILSMLPEDHPLLAHLLDFTQPISYPEKKDTGSDNPFSCI